jgi:hypothetical protein
MISLHSLLHPKKPQGSVQRDPVRDWLALLTATVIVGMGIAVWAAWVYTTVSNSGMIGTPRAVTRQTFDDSSLKKIREVFEMRAGEEAKYLNRGYSFIDPSQ